MYVMKTELLCPRGIHNLISRNTFSEDNCYQANWKAICTSKSIKNCLTKKKLMLKMKVNPIVNEEGLDIHYEKTQKYSH